MSLHCCHSLRWQRQCCLVHVHAANYVDDGNRYSNEYSTNLSLDNLLAEDFAKNLVINRLQLLDKLYGDSLVDLASNSTANSSQASEVFNDSSVEEGRASPH